MLNIKQIHVEFYDKERKYSRMWYFLIGVLFIFLLIDAYIFYAKFDRLFIKTVSNLNTTGSINNTLNITESISNISENDTYYINKCSNYSELSNYSWCINEWFLTFFKYNVSDDHQSKTLEEIKEFGGDCVTWSNLYAYFLKEKNFKYNYTVISPANDTLPGHEYLYGWSEDNESGLKAYCNYDLKNVNCFIFEK